MARRPWRNTRRRKAQSGDNGIPTKQHLGWHTDQTASRKWALNEAKSIWLFAVDRRDDRTTRSVVGMSCDFQKALRPIFQSVFEELFRHGRVRECLGRDIIAQGDRLHVGPGNTSPGKLIFFLSFFHYQ